MDNAARCPHTHSAAAIKKIRSIERLTKAGSAPTIPSPAALAQGATSCRNPGRDYLGTQGRLPRNLKLPAEPYVFAEARHDLLEILEERYGRRSTIITSQIPVDKWHELIGDPTYADAILDRLVHNAHRIELTGDSLRKRRKAEPAAASVAAVPRARS